MGKYKVVTVEPLKSPIEKEMSFQEIQEFVGGYVAQFKLYEGVVALVNEDGNIDELPPNRNVVLREEGVIHQLVGNFVVVHTTGNDFQELTDDEVKEVKHIFRHFGKDQTVFI